MCLFAAAAPNLAIDERRDLVESICEKPECCLDRAFTLPFLRSLGPDSSQRVAQLMESKCQNFLQRVAQRCRLGIVLVECAHGEVRKYSEACRYAGAPKSFEVLSSDFVLATLKRDHEAAIRTSRPSRPTQRQKDRRRVIRGIVDGRRETERRAPRFNQNGFFLFKNDVAKRMANIGDWQR